MNNKEFQLLVRLDSDIFSHFEVPRPVQ